MDLLRTEQLRKKYGDFTALNGLDLAIKPGCIFGLLGPNGAGKTTLIRMINQITMPDAGQIFFKGERLRRHHIQQIGYLPEERGLYPKMRVAEQIIYLARLKGMRKEEAETACAQWLGRFELSAWRQKTVEELSKGMAQKVQFIATVIHQPELLIFDEPFTGFDPVNTELIKKEIRRLRDNGATVLFSTHRMESVEEICDRIALLHKAEKILEGSVDEVKEAHKRPVYELVLRGDKTLKLPAPWLLMEHHSKDGRHLLKVKPVSEKEAPAVWDLLEQVRTDFELISFQEERPSLNEIFIQKVAEQ